MQKARAAISKWRNRTTMQKQLSIVVALAVTISMLLLIMFNYSSQASANRQQQVSMLRRVLALENRNLDKYISELRAFSLQLRNDSSLMALLSQNGELFYADRQTLESAVKVSFYSRSDVDTFHLYVVRQGLTFSLSRNSRTMTIESGEKPLAQWPHYQQFIQKPDFCSIVPAKNGFVHLTRTIIDSPKETPLAIVEFVANLDMATSLSKGHSQAWEQLCILQDNGEPYFLPEGVASEEAAAIEALVSGGLEHQTLRLAGEDVLCVVSEPSEYGFVLVGMKPMAVVNASLIATRNGSILLGAVLLVLTVLLVLGFIRFITTPLSKLAHRIRRVGTGNFTTRAELKGSSELIGLSEDVNEMMAGIHRLIERNYVSQLNERTAQLTALEAQTNPHFLFNTLQAISTQAILKQQSDIYIMITDLASLLRYSIKGENLVSLETELSHVEKYLSLQKARFGEGVNFELRVEHELLQYAIPKLSVLSLVENSITHGLSGDTAAIWIVFETKLEGDNAIFRVQDNGNGIPPEKLQELRDTLESPSVLITKNIGLTNLASRLRLVYHNQADISIQSRLDPVRQTIVTITIPLEVFKNVSNLAD